MHLLGQEVVDQERQHEQRPEQSLVVALPAGEGRIAADARVSIVDRCDALAMRGRVAQAALADIGGFDAKMRRHREVAEQALTLGDRRIAGRDHVAEAPDRNDAEAVWRGKQLPVFQLLAEQRVSDVVGGEGEAVDLHQQRIARQRVTVRTFRADCPASLQILACDDEVVRLHDGTSAVHGHRMPDPGRYT